MSDATPPDPPLPPPPQAPGGGQPGWGVAPGQGAVPPPPPPGGPPPAWGQQPGWGQAGGYAPTAGSATAALVCSILAWVVCPIVLAIVALVLASRAGDEIRTGGGRVGGDGMVTAARIIAW